MSRRRVEGHVVLGRRSLTLILLALFFLPSGGSAAERAEPERIYFDVQERDGTFQTFTAIPPGNNSTDAEVQFLQRQDRSRSDWVLLQVPVDWQTVAGQGEAVLYLRGLDDTVPVPATDEPDATGRSAGTLRIVVVAESVPNNEVVAQGETSYTPDPVEPATTPQKIVVPLQIHEGILLRGGTNESADDLKVTLTIHGRHATNVSPVHLHAGSTEHPSSLSIPGFPYRALLERDLARLADEECRQAILEKRSCAPTPNGDEQAATPLPAALGLIAVALGLALGERERRTIRPTIVDEDRVRPVRHVDV